MAQKPTLNSVGAGSQLNASQINENFDILANAVADNLGRSGVGERNNTITGDVDLNNNSLRNVGAPRTGRDAVNVNYLSSILAQRLESGLVRVEQAFDLVDGQTLINLTDFTYNPGFNEVLVFYEDDVATERGLRVLESGTDYEETSASSLTLTAGAVANDRVVIAANLPIATTDSPNIPASEQLITARNESIAARDASQTARDEATAQATAAAASAMNIETSATAAATSAANSAASATASATSATAAAGSATAAAQSATDAAASLSTAQGVQTLVETEGNTQVTRVTTEGNTQVARVQTASAVTLRSTRTTTGTWAITGLTANLPLYIIASSTSNGLNTALFRISTGSNDGRGGSSRVWAFSTNDQASNATTPSCVVIPDATTVNVVISSISANMTLRAYQQGD